MVADLPPKPDLVMLAGQRSVTIVRAPGDPAAVELPLYVGSARREFRLVASRGHDGRGPIGLRQVLRDDGGRAVSKAVRLRATSFPLGIDDFVRVRLRDRTGRIRWERTVPFCPNNVREPYSELSRGAPRESRFPSGCGAPLTRATIWGIDRWWAAAVDVLDTAELPDGRYTAEATIDPGRRALDRRRSNDTVHIGFRVRTDASLAVPEQDFSEEGAQVARAGRSHGADLPDLRALPASGMSVAPDEGNRDLLSFGATVWNSGPGPLRIEGLRPRSGATMSARQVLLRRGRRVRNHAAGRLVFDRGDGHNHWHFDDFARYLLVDGQGRTVARSGKIGFCFLPTTPVDLTVPRAFTRQPPPRPTYCGNSFQLSVVMALEVGWGDEYLQTVAGQALDVTNLPNGRYQLVVVADPDRRLLERSDRNNRSSRTVILGGQRCARTVEVPPWFGIETEIDDPSLAPAPPNVSEVENPAAPSAPRAEPVAAGCPAV